jgi:uncharacterized protein YecT (DUF1311 family)
MKAAASIVLVCLLVSSSTQAQRKRKPDPCASAQTQTEMNICAGNEYKAADASLNEVYRQLVSMLDDEDKSQLKEAQTAWLKYRDTNCEFVADQYKGGTIRPMIHAYCLAELTRNRTTELRTQIKDRNN